MMTKEKQACIDEARAKAIESGQPMGVHVVGPERWVLDFFRPGDYEVRKNSLVAVVSPNPKCEVAHAGVDF